MRPTKVATYGSWNSPIKSDLLVAGAGEIEQLALNGNDTYWVELRPTDNGRYVLVRRTLDGNQTDMTPSSFSTHSTVHEYGGGSFVVWEGLVIFSNFADQRLYQLRAGKEPKRMTVSSSYRYADGTIDPSRGRLICVREDHSREGVEPTNTLVSLGINEVGDGKVLVAGNDFYSSPRLSRNGQRLAWLTWSHPNMPWDQTELWTARVADDGSIESAERITGGCGESIFQPEWAPDGALYYISDRNGWWNLYRWNGERGESLCEMDADFGVPQWLFGMSTYAVECADRIICSFTRDGLWHLAKLNLKTLELEPIPLPYTEIWGVRAVQGRAVFCAGSPTEAPSIVQVDIETLRNEVLYRSTTVSVERKYISVPVAIEYPTSDGETAHAFFYPPFNEDYSAPSNERPPLRVWSHGGPTFAASSMLDLGVQYWTSRGVAVLDVNYRGSSGYGRAYRQGLERGWGIKDVDDCINGAVYLTQRAQVDHNRLAIAGRSAGGYTTLCAITFRDLFHAAASHFGLSDLESFVKETHKFESHYLEKLIGPYPAERELYRNRSPINFADRINCPVIFFQGLDDKIVPPNQAEALAERLRIKGIPVAYVAFKGERHGFRHANNIRRTFDGELYFYSRIFNFTVAADTSPPVRIANL